MKRPKGRRAWSWRDRMRRPLLAVVGLNLLAALVYTLPRTLKLRNVSARVQELRQEAAGLRQRAEHARYVNETLRLNAADASRFYAEIVPERRTQLQPLLEYLEATAEEQQLTVRNRSYTSEEIKGLPLTRLVINMPMVGQYSQVVAFLDKLERSPRFLVVDQVELRQKGESDKELQFVVSAYFKRDPGGKRAD